jgi:hypothetical protein
MRDHRPYRRIDLCRHAASGAQEMRGDGRTEDIAGALAERVGQRGMNRVAYVRIGGLRLELCDETGEQFALALGEHTRMGRQVCAEGTQQIG